MLNRQNGGDGIVDAALIALGPYLAPGRIVVPKSNGSPNNCNIWVLLHNSLWSLSQGKM